MNKLLGTTLVSVCFAAAGASVAMAQTSPNMNTPSTMGHAHMMSADRPFSRPTERVEARLAYVKTALKITEAQQPQWDAYAGYARKSAQEMEQRWKSMHSGASGHHGHERANAIERLEKAQSRHAETVTRLGQFLAVLKPLYTALSPEQQKVADVVLNRQGRSMDGQSMHGRGGPGMNH